MGAEQGAGAGDPDQRARVAPATALAPVPGGLPPPGLWSRFAAAARHAEAQAPRLRPLTLGPNLSTRGLMMMMVMMFVCTVIGEAP